MKEQTNVSLVHDITVKMHITNVLRIEADRMMHSSTHAKVRC